jgi:glycosyl transferase family 25
MLSKGLAPFNTYFDRVYVVTVERFKDRQRSVSENLEGLDFRFFYGTDKNAIDKEDLIRKGIYDEARARKVHRHSKALSIGEIACSLSHRSLYEKINADGSERVLILEDDVSVNLSSLAHLDLIFRELPPDWDLVYFGYLKHEYVTLHLRLKQIFYKIIGVLGLMKWSPEMISRFLPRPYSAHLKKAGFHDCTHAYAISRKAVLKLIKAQTPVIHRADDLLSQLVMKGELNAYVTEPKIFDQEGFSSDSSVSMVKEA